MNAISDANILLDDIVSTYSDNLWGWPHNRHTKFHIPSTNMSDILCLASRTIIICHISIVWHLGLSLYGGGCNIFVMGAFL